MAKIKEAGFHIAARKETTLTREIAQMLYAENTDKDYYNDLIEHMTRSVSIINYSRTLCVSIYEL